jgi:excisionase family DNA binding protein
MATEKPIGTKEAAEMLGVIPRTVVRLAERGDFPGFKVGDTWRFYRSDIEAYIQQQMERTKHPNKQEEE